MKTLLSTQSYITLCTVFSLEGTLFGRVLLTRQLPCTSAGSVQPEHRQDCGPRCLQPICARSRCAARPRPHAGRRHRAAAVPRRRGAGRGLPHRPGQLPRDGLHALHGVPNRGGCAASWPSCWVRGGSSRRRSRARSERQRRQQRSRWRSEWHTRAGDIRAARSGAAEPGSSCSQAEGAAGRSAVVSRTPGGSSSCRASLA